MWVGGNEMEKNRYWWWGVTIIGPTSRFTLCTATCRTQLWYRIKETNTNPDALNTSCLSHIRLSTDGTPQKTFSGGDRSRSVANWWKRRQRLGQKLKSAPTGTPYARYPPYITLNKSCGYQMREVGADYAGVGKRGILFRDVADFLCGSCEKIPVLWVRYVIYFTTQK